MAYKGHHYDRDWNVIYTENWSANDPRWESEGIMQTDVVSDLFRVIGLFPVGVPPRRVDEMEGTWSEWTHVTESTKKGEEGKKVTSETRELRVRNELTRYFYLKKFPYAHRMKNVETSLGIRVDLDFTTYVIGVNPMTATVHNEDWFLQMEEVSLARARSYVGGNNFFNLLSEDEIARGNLRSYHPLLRRIEERMRASGSTPANPPQQMEPFGKFMSEIKGRDQRRINQSGISDLQPLEKILGVKILDATIANISLSEGEKALVDKLSEITLKDIELENREKEMETRKKELRTEGEGKAAAIDAETAALRRRYEEVDLSYLQNGGSELAQAGRHAQALVRVAEALEKNSTLTSIVMPQADAPRVVVPSK